MKKVMYLITKITVEHCYAKFVELSQELEQLSEHLNATKNCIDFWGKQICKMIELKKSELNKKEQVEHKDS